MKKTLALLIWPLLAAAAAQTGVVRLPAPPDRDTTAEAIREITDELARISGLTQLHPVDYNRIPKAEVKAFLERRVKEEVKPEEIEAEQAALEKLGFAPAGFDLKKTTIDLLTEQAAAFYDFRKKKLFMIDAGSDMVQHSALVHELAHALADQHFHLEKFIDSVKKDDDSSLARMAVMEGQATWLMSEYLTQRTGQSLVDEPVLVEMMASSAETSAGQFPVFDKAPLYLKATLLFPYTSGMRFQNAVVKKMGKEAFREVFRNPPVSTQQVLHPEKYFAGVKPRKPELPAFERHGYKNFTDGELGELDHSVLLKQYAGEAEARELAPEWRGGAFELLKRKSDGRMVLRYASEWSGPEAARRFFADYQKALAGKWKRFEVESKTATAVTGRGDDGWFRLELDGARVTSLEGLPSPR